MSTMTLEQAIDRMDEALGITGYCSFEQSMAWAIIRKNLRREVKVPDGWQLVPVDATDEMIAAGYKAIPKRMYGDVESWEASPIWDAMLAAAPATPATDGRGEADT